MSGEEGGPGGQGSFERSGARSFAPWARARSWRISPGGGGEGSIGGFEDVGGEGGVDLAVEEPVAGLVVLGGGDFDVEEFAGLFGGWWGHGEGDLFDGDGEVLVGGGEDEQVGMRVVEGFGDLALGWGEFGEGRDFSEAGAAETLYRSLSLPASPVDQPPSWAMTAVRPGRVLWLVVVQDCSCWERARTLPAVRISSEI